MASDLPAEAPPLSLGTSGDEGKNSAGLASSMSISPLPEKDVDVQKPDIGRDYLPGSKQSMDNGTITRDDNVLKWGGIARAGNAAQGSNDVQIVVFTINYSN